MSFLNLALDQFVHRLRLPVHRPRDQDKIQFRNKGRKLRSILETKRNEVADG